MINATKGPRVGLLCEREETAEKQFELTELKLGSWIKCDLDQRRSNSTLAMIKREQKKMNNISRQETVYCGLLISAGLHKN